MKTTLYFLSYGMEPTFFIHVSGFAFDEKPFMVSLMSLAAGAGASLAAAQQINTWLGHVTVAGGFP